MHGKEDNSFFRHYNWNQWESICTDLTYESAQVKLFSRLLGCNIEKVEALGLKPKPFGILATINDVQRLFTEMTILLAGNFPTGYDFRLLMFRKLVKKQMKFEQKL